MAKFTMVDGLPTNRFSALAQEEVRDRPETSSPKHKDRFNSKDGCQRKFIVMSGEDHDKEKSKELEIEIWACFSPSAATKKKTKPGEHELHQEKQPSPGE